MPGSAELLEGLATIANGYLMLAMLWHVLLAVMVSALVLGWWPSRRIASLCLAALPTSVSLLAFRQGNPFNGLAFGLLAVLLLRAHDVRPVRPAHAVIDRWLGGGLIAFGWVYPHFLHDLPVAAYVVAAPTGLLPCPTLAILTGVIFLKRELLPGSLTLVVAAYGLFYGLFGTLRLGVQIDLMLLFGAVSLATSVVLESPRLPGSVHKSQYT
jgi:hypothetical protein